MWELMESPKRNPGRRRATVGLVDEGEGAEAHKAFVKVERMTMDAVSLSRPCPCPCPPRGARYGTSLTLPRCGGYGWRRSRRRRPFGVGSVSSLESKLALCLFSLSVSSN